MGDMVERIAQAMAENNDFCWDYCDKPTWRRDARLALELSGATEMLAALRDLIKSHDNMYLALFGPDSDPLCDIAAKPARAAIAKADPAGGRP